MLGRIFGGPYIRQVSKWEFRQFYFHCSALALCPIRSQNPMALRERLSRNPRQNDRVTKKLRPPSGGLFHAHRPTHYDTSTRSSNCITTAYRCGVRSINVMSQVDSYHKYWGWALCGAGAWDSYLSFQSGYRSGKADGLHNDHFWSYHPNGANFLMADGAVRFIHYRVNHSTLLALATRRGREVVGEH